MSSFRSYWSSVKYHAVTKPSINIAKKAVQGIGRHFAPKVRTWLHSKKVNGVGLSRKPGVRKAVLNATRGKYAMQNGVKPTNKSFFSKATSTGRARRAALAQRAKYIQRPKRSLSAPISAIKPTPSQIAAARMKRSAPAQAPHAAVPKPVATKKTTVVAKPAAPLKKSPPIRSTNKAIKVSKTHGELRRRLGGIATREFTRSVGQGMSRKATATMIKHMRKQYGSAVSRKIVRDNKAKRIAAASKTLGHKI